MKERSTNLLLMDFTPRLESDERIYSHKIRFQAGRREYASQGTYTCEILGH